MIQRLEDNAQATQRTAQKDYPAETWLAANTVRLRYTNLPKNLEGISIAKSKFPMNKEDERTLLKEVKQAKILVGIGASVNLIPKLKDPFGKNIPGPDAIVNGRYTEFKTVTGSIKKVEKHFRRSRTQGENVYFTIDNPDITKADILSKLSGVINSGDYTGGFKGNVIFTVGSGENLRTYFVKINSLKK